MSVAINLYEIVQFVVLSNTMFIISQILFCVLMALGVTTGELQVPVCVPATGQSQQSTGFNKESPEKHIIIKG